MAIQKVEGVDYLYEVLSHEIMASQPTAPVILNHRLAQHYVRSTPSQRYVLDRVFRDLCHQSFLRCFNTAITRLINQKKMNQWMVYFMKALRLLQQHRYEDVGVTGFMLLLTISRQITTH